MSLMEFLLYLLVVFVALLAIRFAIKVEEGKRNDKRHTGDEAAIGQSSGGLAAEQLQPSGFTNASNRDAGAYEEKLPCGGTLVVSRRSWEIRYYFAGPDLRHRGTSVSVPGQRVAEYLAAFEKNFAEFERLQLAVPSGGEFSTEGMCGMIIRIGRFNAGVCIEAYHMPIDTRGQLMTVKSGYRYAMQRAPQIQGLLSSL